MDAMERVIGPESCRSVVTHPFTVIESAPIVNDTVNKQGIVIFYVSDTNFGFA